MNLNRREVLLGTSALTMTGLLLAGRAHAHKTIHIVQGEATLLADAHTAVWRVNAGSILDTHLLQQYLAQQHSQLLHSQLDSCNHVLLLEVMRAQRAAVLREDFGQSGVCMLIAQL